MKKSIRMNEHTHQPNSLFLFTELYSHSHKRNETSCWPDISYYFSPLSFNLAVIMMPNISTIGTQMMMS